MHSMKLLPFVLIILNFIDQAFHSSATELAVSQLQFSDKLTKSLYDDQDECTSSLGVSMCFSLIYPCMNGNAKIETEEVLGFPQDIQKLVWSDTVTQIVATYDGKCIGQEADDCLRRPLVEIENSIWIDNEDTLNVAYEGIVGDYLKYIDFQSEIAGNQVNEWVKEKTHGLIDSLVLPGPLSPLILLPVNTIYVKGNWKSEFSPRQTNQDVFYTNAKRNAKVKDNAHFMHKVGYYSYSGDALPGYQVLKLPFTKDSLSMILVLPTSDSPNLVAWTKIIEALPDLESTRLAIAIPKFRLESEYTDDLKTSLVGIGLEKPFLEGLCVFEDDCSAFISQIIQKTAIQMDEKGVEAAAATAIMIATSSQYEPDPILFLADHPFQYIIFDEVTDSVLFEGVSGNPEPPEEATAPLGGKHSDSNFWTANFGVNPKSWSDEKPNILAWLLSALSAIFSSLCAFTAIFA